MNSRVSLITGSSRGIGAASALAFARAGYAVALAARSSDALNEVAAQIRRGSGPATGGGSIVNMSSTAGLQGVAGLAPYSAAKHGVIGLTKSVALDYAAAGIRVNAVAPGPIASGHINEEQQRQIGEYVPIKRVGTSEEVAQLVVWLCSSESGFITGTVVSIDGGRMAGTPAFAIR